MTTITDYVGGFVYTNNALSFFTSPEGRVVKNGSNFEYEYALTDHQGNTRVLFTSAPQAAQATAANMEADANPGFQNYENLVGFDLFDHTDAGTVYQYSQKLTGGHNAQVGLAKTYNVMAGDKVKIELFAKYYNPQSSGSNLIGFATALAGAFGVSAASTGEALKAYNGLNNYGGLVAAGTAHNDNGFPKLFVNILLFDKNYVLIDAAWQQIDGGEQPAGNATKLPHDYLSAELTAREPGYAYVYFSNESATLVEGYFDDVTMTYTPGNILQYNEYYPFGLNTANSWTRENVTTNNFLANGGTELNTTSNLYDLEYRNYDPVLGRMNGVDPMATKYASLTPYNFSFNDPVTFTDVNGADPNNPNDGDYRGSLLSLYNSGQWSPGHGQGMDSDSGFGGWGVAGSGLYRQFGNSMSFGLSPYSAAYHNQMLSDAYSLTVGAYSAKYGDTYVNQGYWDSSEQTVGFDPLQYEKPLSSELGVLTIQGIRDIWVDRMVKVMPQNSFRMQQQQTQGGWLAGAASASLAFMSADISVPDPTDAAWPKWVGYGATAAIAGGILYFEGVNPQVKNMTTSRGVAWTEPPRKPTPGGDNPPEWVKNILISMGAVGLLNNLGKINPELSPKNWDGSGINNLLNQTGSYFNNIWNTTVQGMNDVHRGLKNGWPGY